MADNPHYESDALSIDLGDLEMDSVPIRSSIARSTRSTRRAEEEEAGPSAPRAKKRKTSTRGSTKTTSRRGLAAVEEESSSDSETGTIHSTGAAKGSVAAYREGIYHRLDAISAKIDTLVSALTESTRQVRTLAETVGLQQTRMESLQTTVTRSVTQAPNLYPSLTGLGPAPHMPVQHVSGSSSSAPQAAVRVVL